MGRFTDEDRRLERMRKLERRIEACEDELERLGPAEEIAVDVSAEPSQPEEAIELTGDSDEQLREALAPE